MSIQRRDKPWLLFHISLVKVEILTSNVLWLVQAWKAFRESLKSMREKNKLYLTCAYTHLCRSLSQFLENKSIRSIFTSAGWDDVSPIRQLSLNRVKSFPGLHWFCFTSLCDWSRKLTPLSQPIRCKTKTKHDLLARVFPRFRMFGRFLSFHWPLQVFSFHRIGRRDYFGFVLMTLNRKAL